MKLRLLFLFVTLAAASFLANGGISTGKLSGAVIDSSHAPVQNATVLVHWDQLGAGEIHGELPPRFMKEETWLKTNRLGNFSLDLSPGFYDFVVFAHGYDPRAYKVRISAGKTTFQESWLLPNWQVEESRGR